MEAYQIILNSKHTHKPFHNHSLLGSLQWWPRCAARNCSNFQLDTSFPSKASSLVPLIIAHHYHYRSVQSTTDWIFFILTWNNYDWNFVYFIVFHWRIGLNSGNWTLVYWCTYNFKQYVRHYFSIIINNNPIYPYCSIMLPNYLLCSPIEHSFWGFNWSVLFVSFELIIYTLQPHYNTVVYSTNSVITRSRLGSHCLYFLCIRPSL